MGLLRLVALALFLVAAFAAFGWLLDFDALTILGLDSLGLAFYVASTVPVPDATSLR